jgi:hypothetical protein
VIELLVARRVQSPIDPVTRCGFAIERRLRGDEFVTRGTVFFQRWANMAPILAVQSLKEFRRKAL